MSENDKLVKVALSTRREEVIAALSEHFATDNLDVEEFDERVALAEAATKGEHLEKLLSDLPVLSQQQQALVKASNDDQALAAQGESKRIVAIFGGSERKGPWNVPKRLKVISVFGGAELDLREANLPPGEIEIKIRTVFGGVEIIVPPDLSVEMEGTAILGGFEESYQAPQKATTDRKLKISGWAVMGGVEVRSRYRGESSREARRRRKKELREDRRKQLRDKND